MGYDTDNIDETDIISTTPRSTTPTSGTEYEEYRQWKNSRIREDGIAEGRKQASVEHQAQEASADAAALTRLTSKGLTLRDAFGACATTPGRNAIINLSRTSFATQSGLYPRLRRMAVAQGLCK
jgi:hypothetical protein